MTQTIKVFDGNWKLCYEQNKICKSCADSIKTISDINNSGYPIIEASVPGNFELDLQKQGIIDDPFFGTNSWEMRNYENYHVWYFTEFDSAICEKDDFIHFEGIDTVADIYLNGKLVKTIDNMFISHDVELNDLVNGKNELVVHIKPVSIYSRQFELPASSHPMTKYMAESLYVRKAAHMYGWDIMPRIVSCGIWKPVSICRNAKNRIKNAFVFTMDILNESTAKLCANITLEVIEDDLRDYFVEIDGKCHDSKFHAVSDVWHTGILIRFNVENAKFWWPKGAGKAYLYDVTIKLLYKNEICDVYTLKTGIRLIELENSEVIDEKGNGKFCFKVNHEPIYARGTNWVPLDAYHSRDIGRLPQALEILDEVGCNMVRCWGGNVYESDLFYDFCDEHGILIWQDFAMGCAVYPQEQHFFEMISKEVEFIVKRLRNHPSLALWSGDNEGDVCYRGWLGYRKNPNDNRITREIIPKIIHTHDFTRPYIPSSPYISNKCFIENMKPVEEHPWGIRDWYKSDWYKNLSCIFASEIGFYGVPELNSLKEFISNDKLWPIKYDDGTYNEQWVAHSTSPEKYISDSEIKQSFAYFAELPLKNVKELFGVCPDNLEDYICQTQIFQAEGMKYLIERFRAQKWNKTGLIWWNLLNGWPQIDNGVVDYYFKKKLAFNYIKLSQQEICLVMQDDEKDKISLVGCNDTLKEVNLNYYIYDISENNIILNGEFIIQKNNSVLISELCKPNKQKLYAIVWEIDGKKYYNHFVSFDKPMNYCDYEADLKKYNELKK